LKPRSRQVSQQSKSRKKGSSFERQIVQWLKDWTGMTFSRTPGSGSGAIKGDVIPIRGFDFPYVIECKNVQAVQLDSMFQGAGTLYNFFRKVESECSGNLQPLLIFKKKQLGPMIIMYASAFEALTGLTLEQCHARKFSEFCVIKYKTAKNKSIKLIAMNLEELEKLPYSGRKT
jgi:Holliday junction resolvase